MIKNLAILVVFIFSSSVVAEENKKVVLHLSNQHKLHVLVNNVTNIRAAYGSRVDIVVVVNGPAVTKFAKFSNTEEQVQRLLKQNAQLAVCSIAMENKKMLKHQLIEGVTYLTEGGVAKLIDLQMLGYSYIKI